MSRLVVVNFRWPHAVASAVSVSKVVPKEVDRLTGDLVSKGCTVLSVDGVKPPKGSDGHAFFDDCAGGPYWVSEL